MQTIKQIIRPNASLALLLLVMVATTMLATISPVSAQTTDLLISEYIEGSSNNKALEIFNGTADEIELSEYQLLRYSNGSDTATTISFDSYLMVPGSIYVIANEFADTELLDLAQQTSSELNFNGNDSLVLVRGNTVVDSFGQVGFDPGISWTCPGGTTINQTLRRMPGVCNGDDDTDLEFDPCLQYEFFSVDSFDGLGEHNSDCISVGTNRVVWNLVKSQYR